MRISSLYLNSEWVHLYEAAMPRHAVVTLAHNKQCSVFGVFTSCSVNLERNIKRTAKKKEDKEHKRGRQEQ